MQAHNSLCPSSLSAHPRGGAFASEASKNSGTRRVDFWTSPGGAATASIPPIPSLSKTATLHDRLGQVLSSDAVGAK
jgi:hypothetical protein